MSRHEKTAPRRTRLSGSGRVRALLSLGMVLGLGTVGTLAAWSSTAKTTTGTFSTGSIVLKLANDRETHQFSALGMAKMLPGNSIAAMLPVQNRGTTNFTYTTKVKATGPAELASLLEVRVYSGGNVTGTGNFKKCSASSPIATKDLVKDTSVDLITTPRPLAHTSGHENLCIQVTLKPAATPAAQGMTVNAAFEFIATAT